MGLYFVEKWAKKDNAMFWPAMHGEAPGPGWDGKRPGLRPGVTAKGDVENGEGRREAFRGRGRTAEAPVKAVDGRLKACRDLGRTA